MENNKAFYTERFKLIQNTCSIDISLLKGKVLIVIINNGEKTNLLDNTYAKIRCQFNKKEVEKKIIDGELLIDIKTDFNLDFDNLSIDDFKKKLIELGISMKITGYDTFRVLI
ncbi:MAG: hypothetical protein ACOCV8_03950 [Spirochaetota bacterium]